MTRSGVAWGLCGLFFSLSAVFAQDFTAGSIASGDRPGPAASSSLTLTRLAHEAASDTSPRRGESLFARHSRGYARLHHAPGQRQGRPKTSAANTGSPAPAATAAPRAAPPRTQAAAAGRESADRVEIPLTLEPIADDVAEPSPRRAAGSGPAAARDARRSPSRPLTPPPGTDRDERFANLTGLARPVSRLVEFDSRTGLAQAARSPSNHVPTRRPRPRSGVACRSRFNRPSAIACGRSKCASPAATC